jgi:hypothetical protein
MRTAQQVETCQVPVVATADAVEEPGEVFEDAGI